jgi:putative membrane protein
MIERFSDHAANERTFLAWVRTAIAIMAFGFVVERFDVFLRVVKTSASQRVGRFVSSQLGEAAGLGLMAAGLAMVVLAAVRFLRTRRQIEDATPRPDVGSRLDLVLAAMLFLLGCALVAYLAANLAGA